MTCPGLADVPSKPTISMNRPMNRAYKNIFFIVLFLQMSLVKRNNNVQFVCIPNPPIPGLAEGPVTMLMRVKNADMADELEAKMKERLEQEKE